MAGQLADWPRLLGELSYEDQLRWFFLGSGVYVWLMCFGVKERKPMDKAKVIAAAIRPYLRHKGDDGFVAGEVLRGLQAAGFGWIDPYATRVPRVYTDADCEVWSDGE